MTDRVKQVSPLVLLLLLPLLSVVRQGKAMEATGPPPLHLTKKWKQLACLWVFWGGRVAPVVVSAFCWCQCLSERVSWTCRCWRCCRCCQACCLLTTHHRHIHVPCFAVAPPFATNIPPQQTHLC